MNKKYSTTLPAVVSIVAAGLLLTGCAAGHDAAPTGTSTAKVGTATSTPPAGIATLPSATGTATPTRTATSSSPTDVTAATAAPSAGTASGVNGGSDALPRCDTAQLTASLADGGGTVGQSFRVAIILHNASQQPCTLQGWPGVSFVGDGNGTQIGASATLDRSSVHPTEVLRHGGEVQALVSIVQSSKWDAATCRPRVTDGFRVIPPGSTQSIFVGASGSSFEACANPQSNQLTTTALSSL